MPRRRCAAPAPKKLDVFLTPERGDLPPRRDRCISTALVRDDRANAAVTGDLPPVTMVVERPDGVEFQPQDVLKDGGLGGYSDNVALDPSAMRGSWTRSSSSPTRRATPIAETTVLVEDFEPDRLAFDVDHAGDRVRSQTRPRPASDIAARYLYGATRPGPCRRGRHRCRRADTLDAYPGYQLRPHRRDHRDRRARRSTIDATTDDNGKASFDVTLPAVPSLDPSVQRPPVILRVADTNGRAVERTLSLPVKTTAPLIGVKPQFDAATRRGEFQRFLRRDPGRSRRQARRQARASPGNSSGVEPTTSGTRPMGAGTTSRCPTHRRSTAAQSISQPTAPR